VLNSTGLVHSYWSLLLPLLSFLIPSWSHNPHSTPVKFSQKLLSIFATSFLLILHLVFSYTLAVAWLGGSVLILINEVTLRWAQLVLGWLTAFGHANHHGM